MELYLPRWLKGTTISNVYFLYFNLAIMDTYFSGARLFEKIKLAVLDPISMFPLYGLFIIGIRKKRFECQTKYCCQDLKKHAP